MPNTSDPSSLTGILEWLGGVASSSIIAYIGMLAKEPKKERIKIYNDSVKELSKTLKEAHSASIEYWSKDGPDSRLEAKLIAAKTECYRIMVGLSKKCTLFQKVEIKGLSLDYFKAVTGSSFRSPTRQKDDQLLHQANLILENLQRQLDNSIISMRIRNLVFLKVD